MRCHFETSNQHMAVALTKSEPPELDVLPEAQTILTLGWFKQIREIEVNSTKIYYSL